MTKYVYAPKDIMGAIKKLQPCRTPVKKNGLSEWYDYGYTNYSDTPSLSAKYDQVDADLYVVKSYETPIAYLYADIGFCVFNERKYSMTTSRQQYSLKRALDEMKYVVLPAYSDAQIREYGGFIGQLREKYRDWPIRLSSKHINEAMYEYEKLWEWDAPAQMAVEMADV